jgi:D-3-phosphoglycerate dehydrogenase / 2-oxoglutarate reductase
MASSARDISKSQSQVSQSLSFSLSSSASFQSPPSSYGGPVVNRVGASVLAKHLKPFATEDIKILLLENVNQTGRNILVEQGYQVEFLKTSLSEDELIEKIRFDFQTLLPVFVGLSLAHWRET